jgi:predicted Zn-dependent protease
MHLPLALFLLAADGGPATVDDAEKAMRTGRFAEALSAGQALGAAGSASADDSLRLKRIIGVAEIGLAEAGAAQADSMYRDAIVQLAAYRAAHGNELFVQAKLGEAYLRTGSLDVGLALLDPLIAEAAIPDLHVWSAMAQAKQQKGDVAGARLAAKACLRLDADDAGCKGVLAAVGEKKGKK